MVIIGHLKINQVQQGGMLNIGQINVLNGKNIVEISAGEGSFNAGDGSIVAVTHRDLSKSISIGSTRLTDSNCATENYQKGGILKP